VQIAPPEPEARKAFRLESDIIREIARAHPRFAATLANINVFGFDPKLRVYRVHWTPVEISSDDIDAFLDRHAHPGFFEQYNRRGRELNRLIQKGSLEKILYILTVASSKNATMISLSVRNDLRTIPADPPYSALEMTLQDEDAVIGTQGTVKFTKSTWHIN